MKVVGVYVNYEENCHYLMVDEPDTFIGFNETSEEEIIGSIQVIESDAGQYGKSTLHEVESACGSLSTCFKDITSTLLIQ